MKILHVDDHEIFAQGLAMALEAHLPEAHVLYGLDAAQALHLLEANVDIDLAIVDLNMPGIDGRALIDALGERDMALPVVVMSAVEDPWLIRDCLRAGAMGFVPKVFGKDEIIAALERVLAGEVYLPHRLAERLQQLPDEEPPEAQRVAKGLGLGKRQLDVLALMRQGYGNREIADILCISEHTVKSHARVLFQTLGVNNRLECVREAERTGLI